MRTDTRGYQRAKTRQSICLLHISSPCRSSAAGSHGGSHPDGLDETGRQQFPWQQAPPTDTAGSSPHELCTGETPSGCSLVEGRSRVFPQPGRSEQQAHTQMGDTRARRLLDWTLRKSLGMGTSGCRNWAMISSNLCGMVHAGVGASSLDVQIESASHQHGRRIQRMRCRRFRSTEDVAAGSSVTRAARQVE